MEQHPFNHYPLPGYGSDSLILSAPGPVFQGNQGFDPYFDSAGYPQNSMYQQEMFNNPFNTQAMGMETLSMQAPPHDQAKMVSSRDS